MGSILLNAMVDSRNPTYVSWRLAAFASIYESSLSTGNGWGPSSNHGSKRVLRQIFDFITMGGRLLMLLA